MTNEEREMAIRAIIRTIVKAHLGLIEEREKRKTLKEQTKKTLTKGLPCSPYS